MKHVWGFLLAAFLILAAGSLLAAPPRPQPPAPKASATAEPSSAPAPAPLPTSPSGKRLVRVAVVPSEPFMIYDEAAPEESRPVEGFSADLWREIATRMNVETKWVFYKNMGELTDAIKGGKVDAGIAAITISKEREGFADFSTSMYESGLRIMTRAEQADTSSTMKALFKRLFWNTNMLKLVGFLVLVAHVVWFFNRRRNEEFVPKPYLQGIREALRWSAQILIGVGGTPIPKKGVPWFVGITWVFGGKLLFVVLTGVFSAAFALAAIGDSINGISDLKNKRTAVVIGNSPEKYMEKVPTNLVRVQNVKEGVDKVASGEVDAFVHDAPRLQFWRGKINDREKKEVIRVTPEDFNRQNYGIIFPSESKLRKDVNIQLLNLREPKTPGEKSVYDDLKAKWIPQ